jgi:ABC-type antimicrobial peptide transport system permease subunit
MAALAALAAVLAVVGISGIAAHFLAAQRREVAVRMAMGAGPGREVRRVLRYALLPAVLGLVIGLGATAGLAELAERFWLSEHWPGLLYETPAVEPVTYGVVALLLVTVSVAAAWVPSRRTTSVDPARILNGEG